MLFAQRVQNIAPFHVMRILESAKLLESQGIDVCHMEVGEPDFETAFPIQQAGVAALSDNFTKYTQAAGIPELRQRIAQWYAERFGVRLDADRVIVTPGASGALQLLMGLLLDPGDEILLTDPGYPCNRHLAILAGGSPVSLNVSAENNYQPTPEQVREVWKSGKSKALLIASPANPTGAVISRERLKELYECVSELGGLLVVDEIYQGLTYSEDSWSALELGNDIIVINSFSKYFGMTGWRIGWMVAPLQAVQHLERIAQNSYLSATTTSQYAALASFSEEAVEIHEQRRAAFRQRRDYLRPALESLGFSIDAPAEGAFYLYANCSAICNDANWLVEKLLNQAHVACTPGDDFGKYQGNHYIRFAYTRSIEHLSKGIARMEKVLPLIIEAWRCSIENKNT